MSIEENKKLVRRFCEEVFDQGNVDRIDDFVAPNTSFLGFDELEDFKREFPKNHAALSDVSFDIEDMFAEGDKVCVRGSWSAIHDRGEWLGMNPYRQSRNRDCHRYLPCEGGQDRGDVE